MKLTCVLALCALLVFALVISSNADHDKFFWDKKCAANKVVSICWNCKSGRLNYQ